MAESYLKRYIWTNILHNVQQLTNINKNIERKAYLSHRGSFPLFKRGSSRLLIQKRRPLDNSEDKRVGGVVKKREVGLKIL